MKVLNNKLFITIIHLIIIIIVLFSPILFDWGMIVIGILFYYLQLLLIKDCFLTKIQFNTQKREITMYSYILESLGINLSRSKIRFFADWVLPYLILLIALILQNILNFEPLIF